MKAAPAFPIILFSLLGTLALAQPNERSRRELIVSRIPREVVESSAIATIGYSKRLRALEVEFHSGATYRYLNVPASLYRQLIAADSKARFYDKNIRGKYRSVHVKPRQKK